MRDDNVELVELLPRGEPKDFFFRHKRGKQFGVNYLFEWWPAKAKLGAKYETLRI